MTDVDIKKLAELSRLSIGDEELKQLEQEIPEILEFVDQIKDAKLAGTEKEVGEHYNIMREDGEPHETGKYTKDMIDAMPDSKNGYLKVRKIIQQD
ncbi:Asp-tRNA(Asn)/Glu-tRNA(Gln) amidotransferase GatCAB subunit C [Candidatus Kaiserbacteria bacterium]|nr:MAG: Asp-tRNA(Asn)/Glu-tRNA(Gln) amidotransferase GatCAB subunit C [Candidatus Kaiserbacteria bacterium]